MPRIARYVEADGYYHVISRSINQTWILKDSEDFARFRQLAREAKQQFPIRLRHYVLMNTHFHFVLQVVTPEFLAQHLAHVKWHYTQWMRKKYRWRGPLWRERYKSLPIENETYLAACGRYVEFDPVRAGLCRDPADYPHSSARVYQHGATDDLVDPYPCALVELVVGELDYTLSTATQVFSRSPAIGSSFFIEAHRRRTLTVTSCQMTAGGAQSAEVGDAGTDALRAFLHEDPED